MSITIHHLDEITKFINRQDKINLAHLWSVFNCNFQNMSLFVCSVLFFDFVFGFCLFCFALFCLFVVFFFFLSFSTIRRF